MKKRVFVIMVVNYLILIMFLFYSIFGNIPFEIFVIKTSITIITINLVIFIIKTLIIDNLQKRQDYEEVLEDKEGFEMSIGPSMEELKELSSIEDEYEEVSDAEEFEDWNPEKIELRDEDE